MMTAGRLDAGLPVFRPTFPIDLIGYFVYTAIVLSCQTGKVTRRNLCTLWEVDAMALSSEQLERYSRHIILKEVGLRGQKKLLNAKVLIIGAGGLGAKMIRGIMKEKGVSSLEELIESARTHGVRLVACQMSMDIMGIKKEELIDGVELGGVSTFLGSGEQSDMSLFI
ncbi:MAG: DsrE/DsrF/DrsH-like family protein [Oscillospiraceae bacterium]|nr:DsrE/DsrF/DrsH-like family protein [Oscillospiraceae bacterium]